MTLKKAPSGELFCGRQLRSDFAFLQQIGSEKVAAIREQTSNPEVIAFARDIADQETEELALEEIFSHRAGVKAFGFRSIANAMLVEQIAQMRGEEIMYICSGNALRSCDDNWLEMIDGFHTWRELARIVEGL